MFEYILICLIVTICAFIQGFSGFAFSLVLFPLLAFFISFEELVILNMILSFVLNANVFIKIRKYTKFNMLKWLIIPACIFTVISSLFLDDINEVWFKVFIGFLLILSVVLNVFKLNFYIKNDRKWYPFIGSISGMLNGVSGIGGPPLIIFFQNVKLSKMEYKSLFNKVFLSLNIVAISSYFFQGFINEKIFKLSLITTIFVIIGSSLGLVVSRKVSEKLFKKILLIVILIMGISMVVGGFNEIK